MYTKLENERLLAIFQLPKLSRTAHWMIFRSLVWIHCIGASWARERAYVWRIQWTDLCGECDASCHYHRCNSCTGHVNLLHTSGASMPSVLWRCWLGGRKGIWPVKNRVVGYWCGCLSVYLTANYMYRAGQVHIATSMCLSVCGQVPEIDRDTGIDLLPHDDLGRGIEWWCQQFTGSSCIAISAHAQ